MKAAKKIVLAMALFALVLTLTPLVSYAFNQDTGTGGSGGSGGNIWTVTCQYDGFNRLLSKTCVSGGNAACSCG
jgi:ABC-type cobalt transport system substrate-binding protein